MNFKIIYQIEGVVTEGSSLIKIKKKFAEQKNKFDKKHCSSKDFDFIMGRNGNSGNILERAFFVIRKNRKKLWSDLKFYQLKRLKVNFKNVLLNKGSLFSS